MCVCAEIISLLWLEYHSGELISLLEREAL
jgi:hypothetical protein